MGIHTLSFLLSGFAYLTMFHVAEEWGGNFNPNQATSTILVRIIQESCKCNKLISMCAWATISFSVPAQPQEPPEKKTSESTGQGWGAKNVVFPSFLKI